MPELVREMSRCYLCMRLTTDWEKVDGRHVCAACLHGMANRTAPTPRSPQNSIKQVKTVNQLPATQPTNGTTPDATVSAGSVDTPEIADIIPPAPDRNVLSLIDQIAAVSPEEWEQVAIDLTARIDGLKAEITRLERVKAFALAAAGVPATPASPPRSPQQQRKPGPITPEEREQVYAMADQGISRDEICTRLGLTTSQVGTCLARRSA